MSFLFPAALTAAVETGFFALCGHRERGFLLLSICANVATNVTLNLALGALAPIVDISFWVYPLEAAVLAVEYLVYALYCGASGRLLLLTLCANCLSYCAGLLAFGHV